MDFEDLHPIDDYSHRFFIWHEWIQANGPLTVDNVFDYFATSMFYDKQSNNQVLRMQTIYTGQPIQNEAEELRRFTGIEFALMYAHPPSLFIIHKRERLSPDEVRPLAAYFVANNRIYQAPDLYTVLSNRLLTSIHALQSSLDVLRQYRPDFAPRTGFVWPVVEATSQGSESKEQTIGQAEEPSSNTDAALNASAYNEQMKDKMALTAGTAMPKKRQNIVPLLNAMHTTAMHSKAAPASRDAAEVSVPSELGTDLSHGSTTPAQTQTTREQTPVESKSASMRPPQEAVIAASKVAAGIGKRKRKRGLSDEKMGLLRSSYPGLQRR